MAAWPHLNAECLSQTDPGRCGKHLPHRGCGYVMRVHSRCNDKGTCVKLADCGPDTGSFCGQPGSCADGKKRLSNRFMDLTPAAFSVMASLGAGILPIHIYE